MANPESTLQIAFTLPAAKPLGAPHLQGIRRPSKILSALSAAAPPRVTFHVLLGAPRARLPYLDDQWRQLELFSTPEA